jgi:hypothetical protein
VDDVLANVQALVHNNGLNRIGVPGIEAGFAKEVSYCYTESGK